MLDVAYGAESILVPYSDSSSLSGLTIEGRVGRVY